MLLKVLHILSIEEIVGDLTTRASLGGSRQPEEPVKLRMMDPDLPRIQERPGGPSALK